jgi:hypothetical protein
MQLHGDPAGLGDVSNTGTMDAQLKSTPRLGVEARGLMHRGFAIYRPGT